MQAIMHLHNLVCLYFGICNPHMIRQTAFQIFLLLLRVSFLITSCINIHKCCPFIQVFHKSSKCRPLSSCFTLYGVKCHAFPDIRKPSVPITSLIGNLFISFKLF